MSDYTIVLFKNRTKKKILKKFKTFNNAKKYYDKLCNENKSIIFDKQTENGVSCEYEIAIVGDNNNQTPIYVRDEYGRQVKKEIEGEDLSILYISKFKKEELIYDVKNSKRINLETFLRKYVPKVGVKLISKINHKIVVQKDLDFYLFSLKSDDESSRFIDALSNEFMKNGRIDTIFVKDTSKEQKKYIYDLLESNGFSKTILYRRFTTFPKE